MNNNNNMLYPQQQAQQLSTMSLLNHSMFDVTEEAIFSDMLSELANECALDNSINKDTDTAADNNKDKDRTALALPLPQCFVVVNKPMPVMSTKLPEPEIETETDKQSNKQSNKAAAAHKHKIKRKVDHTYVDYANCDQNNNARPALMLTTSTSTNVMLSPFTTATTHKKGVFPGKLMDILAEQQIMSIISWCPHGRAFIVRNVRTFEKQVLPRYFKTTQAKSFRKQLSLWGFKRITKGLDAGAYYHQLFLRGKPELLRGMKYQKIKGTGNSAAPNPEGEPDFYEMSRISPLPEISTNTVVVENSSCSNSSNHSASSMQQQQRQRQQHMNRMHTSAHSLLHAHHVSYDPPSTSSSASNMIPLQMSSMYAANSARPSSSVLVQHSPSQQHQHRCTFPSNLHEYVPIVTPSSVGGSINNSSRCDDDKYDDGCYVTEEEDNDVHPDEVLSIYKLMSFPGPFTPPPQLLEYTNY